MEHQAVVVGAVVSWCKVLVLLRMLTGSHFSVKIWRLHRQHSVLFLTVTLQGLLYHKLYPRNYKFNSPSTCEKSYNNEWDKLSMHWRLYMGVATLIGHYFIDLYSTFIQVKSKRASICKLAHNFLVCGVAGLCLRV